MAEPVYAFSSAIELGEILERSAVPGCKTLFIKEIFLLSHVKYAMLVFLNSFSLNRTA